MMNQLAKEIAEISSSKGWHFTEDQIPEKLMLMVTELAEAMEEYRAHDFVPTFVYAFVTIGEDKVVKEAYTPELHAGAKPEGLPIELADTIIRILHMCARFNIDIEAAVKLKVEYNKTRSFRHGDKRA